MDQEIVRLEGAVLVLARDQHRGAAGKHRLVDVADLPGAGEGRENKGAQPQAALGAPEGREAAIVALVGQLPLVARVDEEFRLDADLGTQLAHLAQVFQNLYIGSQKDHVLLAAAIGHLQKIRDVVHGLGNRTRGDVQVGPFGANDHVAREGRLEGEGLPGLDHAVEDPLRGRPLGNDLDGLAHGIDALGAGGRNLNFVFAYLDRPNRKIDRRSGAGRHRHRRARAAKQLEPLSITEAEGDLLGAVEVVENIHLDRELLPSRHIVGKGRVDKEILEGRQLRLAEADTAGRGGDRRELPAGDVVGRLKLDSNPAILIREQHRLPDPGLGEILADTDRLASGSAGGSSAGSRGVPVQIAILRRGGRGAEIVHRLLPPVSALKVLSPAHRDVVARRDAQPNALDNVQRPYARGPLGAAPFLEGSSRTAAGSAGSAFFLVKLSARLEKAALELGKNLGQVQPALAESED